MNWPWFVFIHFFLTLYLLNKKPCALQVVGRLRSLNLHIEKFESSDKKDLLLKVSANDAVLKYEAQENHYRCKLKDDHGGAQCGYSMVSHQPFMIFAFVDFQSHHFCLFS